MLGILVLLIEHTIKICMKEIKLMEKTRIAGKFFWTLSVALMMVSCDVLESDPDVLKPTSDITGKEVFVLANSASFIDLNAKLQTNVPARVAVTSDTRHGKVTDLGGGILQYSPTIGNSRARDGFEFTVYTLNNEVIKRDSVIIIIENDSTNLPCNIYPVPDYVYGVKQDSIIDVLSNDIVCGGAVVVSVFKPGNSFPPYYGHAEVIGNKIKYSPGPTFEGVDKIMYKVTATTDTSRVAYGMVYITGDSICSFRLTNDQYTFTQYAVDSLIVLPVFKNDSLCQSINQYQVNLKTIPVYGHAALTANGFSYSVPATASLPFADYFTYEVCIDATCKTARVDIELKQDSVIACAIRARPDSINIAYSNNPQDSIAVLLNDSICGDLKSLTIKKVPAYGTATVSNQQIVYNRNTQQEKDDTLEYEICNTIGCSRATVYIKRTN